MKISLDRKTHSKKWLYEAIANEPTKSIIRRSLLQSIVVDVLIIGGLYFSDPNNFMSQLPFIISMVILFPTVMVGGDLLERAYYRKKLLKLSR